MELTGDSHFPAGWIVKLNTDSKAGIFKGKAWSQYQRLMPQKVKAALPK